MVKNIRIRLKASAYLTKTVTKFVYFERICLPLHMFYHKLPLKLMAAQQMMYQMGD
jgi:hypothetical protein